MSRLFVLPAAVALVSLACRSEAGSVHVPGSVPPHAAAEARQEPPPVPAPSDPASPELCLAACQRVAQISLRAEVAALSELEPRLLPPSLDRTRARADASVAACVEGCTQGTPRNMARCLAAATAPWEIEHCLR